MTEVGLPIFKHKIGMEILNGTMNDGCNMIQVCFFNERLFPNGITYYSFAYYGKHQQITFQPKNVLQEFKNLNSPKSNFGFTKSIQQI